jgi:hypothetical protein
MRIEQIRAEAITVRRLRVDHDSLEAGDPVFTQGEVDA